MKRVFNYIIPTEYDGHTLLSFLKSKEYSSQIITHLKRTENGILLNQEWGRVRDILRTGDTLTIQLIEDTSSENIVPKNMNDIDPVIMLVYITLIIPLICALIYAF